MIETIVKLDIRTSRDMLHEVGREPTPEELAEEAADAAREGWQGNDNPPPRLTDAQQAAASLRTRFGVTPGEVAKGMSVTKEGAETFSPDGDLEPNLTDLTDWRFSLNLCCMGSGKKGRTRPSRVRPRAQYPDNAFEILELLVAFLRGYDRIGQRLGNHPDPERPWLLSRNIYARR